MAIKPVNEIPMTLQEKRQSYREMIRKDIQEAIDNHIERFEFEGDYNWKYLAQYAREEADRIWRSTVYRDVGRQVMEEMKKRFPNERYHSIYMKSGYDFKGRYIKIRTNKGEDRIHVYGEIDYKFAEGFYEEQLSYTLNNKKVIEQRKAEREARINEQRAGQNTI